MNDKPKGLIPEAPFTLSEFQAIERVLWAYGIYLQKAPASAQNARRLQSLEQIRGRLAAQLPSGDIRGVQVFLDVEELEELLQAMLGFATLIKRLFPKNDERDSVIESVNVWLLRLTNIIAEFDV